MPRIHCLGSARPGIFVNSGYLFDAQVDGMVTTYFFDPVSGDWEIAHPPRPLDSSKNVDPATIKALKEKGFELE